MIEHEYPDLHAVAVQGVRYRSHRYDRLAVPGANSGCAGLDDSCYRPHRQAGGGSSGSAAMEVRAL